MKAFAVKNNAKVNSRQTCDGGDVRVSCREKHCHFSRHNKAQREGVCCDSNAKANSRQTCDGGDVRVSCRERYTAISLDKEKAQREGVCCEKQCEGKLKTNL